MVEGCLFVHIFEVRISPDLQDFLDLGIGEVTLHLDDLDEWHLIIHVQSVYRCPSLPEQEDKLNLFVKSSIQQSIRLIHIEGVGIAPVLQQEL